MKHKIILCLSLLSLGLFSQTPWVYNTTGNTSLSSGNIDISGNSVYVGNSSYKVSSSANLNVRALNEIHAQQGFEATAFTNGEAHLFIDPNILNTASFHANGFSGIPQYDRFEIGVKLPDNIQNQINSFLTGGNGLNPYDPDQVAVFCSYNSSTTTYYRNGFYYHDFSADLQSNTWTDQNTDYKFRVRFAPPEIGNYQAIVWVVINNVIIAKEGFSFIVVPSSNPGHLRKDVNLRKLRFENGSVFFGIGQNIPFVGYTPSPVSHNAHRSLINDLAINKGNFVRIRLDPWSIPIETPNNIPNTFPVNLSDCLNNYDHNQTYMWEMDRTLALCENKNSRVYINLDLQIEGMFSDPSDWLHAGWAFSPYSTLWNDPTVATEVQKFFTQNLAKDYYKKRLRYIEARWGYSTSIATWEMMNETEGTNGFFTNTQLRSDIADWTCEMANYIKTSFYPNHLTTTGTTNGLEDHNGNVAPPFNPIMYPHNCLDVYSHHSYDNEVDPITHVHENKYDNQQEEMAKNFLAGRLFFLGELGYGDNANGVNFCNYRNFHNLIWATAMGGGISTGLMWWNWEGTHIQDRSINFPAMNAFMQNVDFTQILTPVRLHPFGTSKNVSTGTGNLSNQEVFTYYMANSNRSHIAGWCASGASFWANDPPASFDDPNVVLHPTDPSANPPTTYIPNYNWIQQSIPTNLNDYNVPGSPGSPTIKLKNMPTGKYHIDVFKTYDAGGIVGVADFCVPQPSDVKLRLPFINHSTASWGLNYPDYAFIVTNMWEKCESDRQGNEGADTLEITINDISEMGKKNGIDRSNDTITTNEIIINGISNIDRKNIPDRIYPTPSSNIVYIDIRTSDWINPNIYIIDALGKEYEKEIGKNGSVDLKGFSNGFYTLKIKDEKHEKVFKMIIQH